MSIFDKFAVGCLVLAAKAWRALCEWFYKITFEAAERMNR